MKEKTHFRKAFNSPYLSSADIVDATVLTISKVALEPDQTKKTKNMFNTAYFAEKELRPSETLKPMILNATNSRTMHKLTGSHYIEDWAGTKVTVYVDPNVRNRGEIVEGLRISTEKPPTEKPRLVQGSKEWGLAVSRFKEGSFHLVEQHRTVTLEDKKLIEEQANEMA